MEVNTSLKLLDVIRSAEKYYITNGFLPSSIDDLSLTNDSHVDSWGGRIVITICDGTLLASSWHQVDGDTSAVISRTFSQNRNGLSGDSTIGEK